MASFAEWRRAANARFASASARAQQRSNVIDVQTVGDEALAQALSGEGTADERYELVRRGSAERYRALIVAGFQHLDGTCATLPTSAMV